MKSKDEKRNSKVDAFLSGAKEWREELEELREILLGCGLTEELKWGKPCYSVDGGNVVVAVPFKNYCALIVTKGALLKDAKGILIKPGEHTQSARQIRFKSVAEIVKMKAVLKAYIAEAIAVEKAGLEVTYKKVSEFEVPEEFQQALDKSAALRKAFKALTPGRQRAYLIHFSGAKQAATRAARVEKWMEQILDGKGKDDGTR